MRLRREMGDYSIKIDATGETTKISKIAKGLKAEDLIGAVVVNLATVSSATVTTYSVVAEAVDSSSGVTLKYIKGGEVNTLSYAPTTGVLTIPN